MHSPGPIHGRCPNAGAEHVRYDANKLRLLRLPSCWIQSEWCSWEMPVGTARASPSEGIPGEMTHRREMSWRIAVDEGSKHVLPHV
jgi:hypothetical protein